MRLAFLGSPTVVVPVMQALVDAGHDVVLVVTRADKRRGRGSSTSPSPVKEAALRMGLPVTSSLDDLRAASIDLAVVAAFGRLLPADVLARHRFVNIHPSLLPRWRGAAPVQRTVLSGDTETGVCLMDLVEEMDAGPIHRMQRTPVGAHESADHLLDRLFRLGAEELVRALSEGLDEPREQSGTPTHAAKLTPEDVHIDWTAPAVTAERKVRVGRAWTTFRGRRLLVHEAMAAQTDEPLAEPGVVRGVSVSTGDGWLVLSIVQPEGKPRMAAEDWARGVQGESILRLD